MTDFTHDLEQCLKVLNEGGVILYPTDTVWGLGCDATNAVAVEKLSRIKGKSAGKGLIVLLTSEREVFQYTASPDPEVFNYLQEITTPTTVIYPHGLLVADEVLSEDGSIAIRIVNEDFCRHLVKRFKKPVVSTSANLHGQPSPQNFKNISTEIKNAVNYVVEFRQDEDKKCTRASSLIKWEKGKCMIIR